MTTVREALERAAARLREGGLASPEREARYLLGVLLDTDHGGLVARARDDLAPEITNRFESWIDRRARREPAQHITGVQEFYGLEFAVDRRVLVPRPETELLVDRALRLSLRADARVADLGTGSGCIAVTLAVLLPGIRVDALDSSEAALTVARENVGRHGVEARVRFLRGDLRRPPEEWRAAMDLVVSNPPYVGEAEWAELEPEVRRHDPRSALVGGPQGHELYPGLARAAHRLLRPGGRLLLELGQGQADHVRGIVTGLGFEGIHVEEDLRGIPRVLVASRGTAEEEGAP